LGILLLQATSVADAIMTTGRMLRIFIVVFLFAKIVSASR
jgi:hypothetical protein